ncbi:MAG TPA: NAD+ synthase [Vicinamibacterales bacterium]|jgi:NAD+ synthase/NAD+ synthase (glutamine-hydrolysing)|nr:NAD+ synthase [Vicinamibacterales bacterium]
MKIALLQIDPTVGDLTGNARLIAEAVRTAGAQGADLAVTPELALVGYLPRDLLLNEGFVSKSWDRLAMLARELADGPPVLVGLPEPNPAEEGRPLFNTAALIHGGAIEQRFRKSLLPTYDVFDEDRYFEPFAGAQVLDMAGVRLGISICEDIWNDRDFWKRRRYHHDPVEELVRAGATAIINLSASPFAAGKQARREEMLSAMARRHRVPLAYVNQYGGNDDLVFDGRSLVFGPDGQPTARGRSFDADVVVAEISSCESIGAATDVGTESEIWRALVLGARDYARKCGFTRVVLGLSGGIDSALTAAIAADALGAANVLGVLMPSPFSSQGSVDDSLAVAAHLGIDTLTIPITGAMEAMTGALQPAFAGTARDVTEENIQARIRGNLLMALSNKRGALLLTTGNKSELAVGYCTLYGDMSGGLGVIADVPKTMVYRIARWLNQQSSRAVIPESILTKAPSAELRPNQTDQDSLPPYDVLDDILQRHIERHQTPEEIVAAGFDIATVARVLALVRSAEFKRKQAAPGIKVTDRAFGTGWRMPIAAKNT